MTQLFTKVGITKVPDKAAVWGCVSFVLVCSQVGQDQKKTSLKQNLNQVLRLLRMDGKEERERIIGDDELFLAAFFKCIPETVVGNF